MSFDIASFWSVQYSSLNLKSMKYLYAYLHYDFKHLIGWGLKCFQIKGLPYYRCGYDALLLLQQSVVTSKRSQPSRKSNRRRRNKLGWQRNDSTRPLENRFHSLYLCGVCWVCTGKFSGKTKYKKIQSFPTSRAARPSTPKDAAAIGQAQARVQFKDEYEGLYTSSEFFLKSKL